MLANANSKPHDIAIYTQGSVTRDRSGWGFSQTGWKDLSTKTVVPTVMIYSLTMEVGAVTHAIQWLATQHDAQITRAIILTDSVNMLQRVWNGLPRLALSHAQSSAAEFLWIYHLGLALFSESEWADRLANTEDVTSGLQLGRTEMLRDLRNFLGMYRPEHHCNDHPQENGERKGSSQHSNF